MNGISRWKISAIGVIGVFILTLSSPYIQEVVFHLPAEKEVESEVNLNVHDIYADFHSEESKCDFKLVYNLNDTNLRKIQKERKRTMNKVCKMCRKDRFSMECNHVTQNEDKHSYLIYKNLLVDDKHKVCTFCNSSIFGVCRTPV